MIIFFGQRWTSTPVGQVEMPCSRCGRQTVHTAQYFSGKFTLFFVPVLPLHGQYQVVCNLCGTKRKALGMLRAQLESLHRTGSIPEGLTLEGAAVPTCSNCGHQGEPSVEKRISTGAWLSSGCLLLLLCLPLFWIPLVMDSLKDEIHRCAKCGRDLAAPKSNRSGDESVPRSDPPEGG